MSDPFKDTRDPLVRTMERRSLEESWANEKRLSARIIKLETALRQALDYMEGRVMSDQIATTPLSGPVEYDFGAQTPEDWPRLYVSKDAYVAEKLRWVRSLTQICSYCGWEAKAGGDSWDALQAHVRSCPEHPTTKLIAALVAVCERGDTDHSAKSMYLIASDALKAAGFNSNGVKLESQSDGEGQP